MRPCASEADRSSMTSWVLLHRPAWALDIFGAICPDLKYERAAHELAPPRVNARLVRNRRHGPVMRTSGSVPPSIRARRPALLIVEGPLGWRSPTASPSWAAGIARSGTRWMNVWQFMRDNWALSPGNRMLETGQILRPASGRAVLPSGWNNLKPTMEDHGPRPATPIGLCMRF